MKRFLLFFLLAPLWCHAAENHETSIAESVCRTLIANEESADVTQLCPGVEGYRLLLHDSDLRQSLSVVAPDDTVYPLELWQVVTPYFSELSESVRWRLSPSGPTALAVSVKVQEHDISVGYTAIAKITKTESCVTEVFPAWRIKEQTLDSAFDRAAEQPCLHVSQRADKKVFGTLTRLEAGDVACYMSLKDVAGNVFDEKADFALCERREALLGKRVYLEYTMANVLADVCEGNPDCPYSTLIALVGNAVVLEHAAAQPICRAGEVNVFSAQCGGAALQLCREGDTLHLRSAIAAFSLPIKAAHGNSAAFSGGGAAWLRLPHGDNGYLLYTGIGKWGAEGETLAKQGMIVEHNASEVKRLRCETLFDSQIGPEWFEQRHIRKEPEAFEPPDF